MDSILNSIKKLMGIPADYVAFDMDLIMHINSVFMILNQLGIGPEEGFSITDETSVWSDFYTRADLDLVKSYVYLKTRLLFDPPTSSAVLNSMEKQVDQYEWRLNVMAENPLFPEPNMTGIYRDED